MTTQHIKDAIDIIDRCSAEELNIIAGAMADRRNYLRKQEMRRNLAELQVGDIVRLKNVKPKYLIGTKAKIIERKGSKFVVELDDLADPRAIRRFGGRPLCPANILEKVK